MCLIRKDNHLVELKYVDFSFLISPCSDKPGFPKCVLNSLWPELPIMVPMLADMKTDTFPLISCKLLSIPYPEPVYTGWSSVHWNATGMPLVDPVYTGIPLEKLSWNSPTLECHWRNLVESAPHWDATGETLTFAAYTGTPLEGLWQPTHAPTHIVKHAE